MPDPIITRDVSVYYEQHGISMDATFEVKYDIDRSETQPGRRSNRVIILERCPIYVSYCDRMDHQYEWRYGENMPARVVRALEVAEGFIAEEIHRKLEAHPYLSY